MLNPTYMHWLRVIYHKLRTTYEYSFLYITNYNSGQAYIIKQFIDHFVDVKKFVNTKHIVFNNDNIIINYSGIGDFACNRVSVKGVLHIEYYKLSNSRYVNCDNFIVKGIFTCWMGLYFIYILFIYKLINSCDHPQIYL